MPKVAYEEELRYLEATFGSEGSPTDVLWKNLRDGSWISKDDHCEFDNLLQELKELWERLTKGGRAGNMEEQRVKEDVRDRLSVQIVCDYEFKVELHEGCIRKGHRVHHLMQLIIESMKKVRAKGCSVSPSSYRQTRPE